MSRHFLIQDYTDPRGLAINLRFKGKQVIHPRARAAQDELIHLIKQAIVADAYIPCDNCEVDVHFTFPTRASDVDGPLKRTLDCIEKAHKAMGHTWNDNRITRVMVEKHIGTPSILLSMRQREES